MAQSARWFQRICALDAYLAIAFTERALGVRTISTSATPSIGGFLTSAQTFRILGAPIHAIPAHHLPNESHKAHAGSYLNPDLRPAP